MPSEDTKILGFSQHQQSDKAPFVVYADFEYLIGENDKNKNNLERSFTIRVGEHIQSGFSMFIISCFISIKNKCDVYRGKDSMKKICESLREHD